MAIKLPSELDHSLGFNLDRVAVLFRRELLRVLAKEGLQPEQWQVLVVLGATTRPQTQQAIADVTLADKHTVSRMLARMQRDGWIVRVPSPDDARSQLVEFTPKARARRPQILKSIQAHFAELLAPLPKGNRDELLKLLRTLRTILRDS